MNKVQLKAKIKCNCEEHYLELLQSFDGENAVYKRMCCKCGKWWMYTERVEKEIVRIVGDKPILYIGTRSVYSTDGSIVDTYYQELMMPGSIFYDRGYENLYIVDIDGTLKQISNYSSVFK